MLGQRIATAIVLLIVLAGVLAVADPRPFEILMAVFVGCALWEWWRLTLSPRGGTGRAHLPAIAAGAALGLVLIAWRWNSGGADLSAGPAGGCGAASGSPFPRSGWGCWCPCCSAPVPRPSPVIHG